MFDYIRFLRVDNSTFSKERFDYARVLMAITSLEVLNFTDKMIIDGVLVELKIVDEWGFSIGEDACLLEDDTISKVSVPDNNFDHVATDTHEHVEDLVNKLAEDWAPDDKDIHKQTTLDSVMFPTVLEPVVCDLVNVLNKEADLEEPVFDGVDPKPTPTNEGTVAALIIASPNGKDTECAELPEHESEGRTILVSKLDAHSWVLSTENVSCVRQKGQSSCPPMATRSVHSGPWSLEWIQDHVHGDVGVVSSSNNKVTSKFGDCSELPKGGMADVSKNKVKSRAIIQHAVHNLKKIARLPNHDRKQVLTFLCTKPLKRKASKRSKELADVITKGSQVFDSSSSVSVNNDWKHYVVLHGNEEVIKEDVCNFGNSLGVKSYDDKANKFRALIRNRKENNHKVVDTREGPK